MIKENELQPVIIRQSDGDYVRCRLGELYLKDEVDEYIAKLKKAQGWRKVSEELPEVEEDYGEIFLVVVETESNTNPKGSYITSAEFCNGEWYNDSTGNEIEENIEREDCFYRSKITHWMPLPSVPKEADK